MSPSSDELSTFINGLLLRSSAPCNPRNARLSPGGSLCDHILKYINSSDFRRSTVDAELAADIEAKVEAHLRGRTPISFAIPFGAYKHWSAWSYPEPEWAEVFNVSYMLSYVKPIANIYEPGVALHYSYGDGVMDRVSNMPPQDTQRYVSAMVSLLGFFRRYSLPNVQIDAVRINDHYRAEEHAAELRAHYEDNVKHWTAKYSEAERSMKLASATRNLMPNGVENLTSLSQEQWEARVLQSAMWCDAHDSLSRRRGFNKFSGHIQLGNIRGRRLELHVGSCETSVHQFWVGVGIVESRRGRLLPRIVSQRMIEASNASGHESHGCAARRINVESPLRELSETYKAVYFLPDHGASVK